MAVSNDQIEKYINVQESNLRFIRERIEIQNSNSYSKFKQVIMNYGKEWIWNSKEYRFKKNNHETIVKANVVERQYSEYDILACEFKIKKAKDKLFMNQILN